MDSSFSFVKKLLKLLCELFSELFVVNFLELHIKAGDDIVLDFLKSYKLDIDIALFSCTFNLFLKIFKIYNQNSRSRFTKKIIQNNHAQYTKTRA